MLLGTSVFECADPWGECLESLSRLYAVTVSSGRIISNVSKRIPNAVRAPDNLRVHFVTAVWLTLNLLSLSLFDVRCAFRSLIDWSGG